MEFVVEEEMGPGLALGGDEELCPLPAPWLPVGCSEEARAPFEDFVREKTEEILGRD
ncbi:hypothetical protein HK101_000832, partial [Irineochytrium annulatum]